MPLDSDVSNGDSQLHVEFYERLYEVKPGTKVPTDFVKIITPGDKTHQWDQPVREQDKQRFPRHWLFYQMKKNEGQVFGTPLADWAKDNPDDSALGHQIAELHLLKFQSVEQVASMTDTQVQKVGMGAAGLRERARSYLASKTTTQTNEDRVELNRTKEELGFLKTQMAALIEQINNRPVEPEKRGPGRPRKVIEDVEHDAPTGDSGNQ